MHKNMKTWLRKMHSMAGWGLALEREEGQKSDRVLNFVYILLLS